MISVGGLLLMCTRKTVPHITRLFHLPAIIAALSIALVHARHNHLNEYYIQGHDNH